MRFVLNQSTGIDNQIILDTDYAAGDMVAVVTAAGTTNLMKAFPIADPTDILSLEILDDSCKDHYAETGEQIKVWLYGRLENGRLSNRDVATLLGKLNSNCTVC